MLIFPHIKISDRETVMEIIAMIQPHKLPDVKQELFKNDIYKMTVTNVLGAGQQKGYTETYRGVISEINLIKKIRLEIAVNEKFVESTIEAIKKVPIQETSGMGRSLSLNYPDV